MPPVLSSHPNAKIRKRSAADLLGFVSALPLLWTRWNGRHRQRQALSELDDRLLADVGLTRRQAERECGKPPWR